MLMPSSLPLLFRPFPRLLPAELPRDRYSNKRPPCPEGRGPIPQPHSPVQRGQEVLPHIPQAAPQSCCDGRLRGLIGWRVCLWPSPAKSSWTRFLPKILPNLPRLCRPSFGQDITQDMARSQPPAKILLFLARIFPKNFLLDLGEVAPFL